MDSPERGPGGSPGGPDWLELGPRPVSDHGRQLRRRLFTALAAVAVVVGLAVAVTTRDSTGDPAERAQEPTQSTEPTTLGPVEPTTRAPTAARARPFTDSALALPGAGKSVLFARTDESLYRIELRTGRVTRTDGVSLGGSAIGGRSGPVSMIAGPKQLFVTDTDSGSGLMIPDGRPAQPLPRGLRLPAQIFPGPPGLLWIYKIGESPARVSLVEVKGWRQQMSLSLGGAWPQPDGRGNLLLSDVGGVYEASRTRLRRLTTGSITAVGTHHYLLVNCDSHRRCSTYLYDRATHKQRRTGPADTSDLTTGTLSPNGRFAALIQWRGSGTPALLLRNLRDESDRLLPGGVNQEGGTDVASSLLWTPDSRWLITLLDGHVTFFDTTTGKSRSSTSALPAIVQLALRPSGVG